MSKRMFSYLMYSIVVSAIIISGCKNPLQPEVEVKNIDSDKKSVVELIEFFTNNYKDPNKIFNSLPYLEKPAKKSWRRWVTRYFIVSQGEPYHMAHDVIVKDGQTNHMVGKFDYGSVFHKDLEYENVHVYIIGTDMNNWEYLGKFQTNSDGKISVSLPCKPVGKYVVRMIVEGDHSETYGFYNVVQNKQKAVIFDIDGTLTTGDNEIVTDYLGIANAQEYEFSQELVELYSKRGYTIIFLTARPYWVAKDTRDWFIRKGFYLSTVHFALTNYNGLIDTENYKIAYVSQLINNTGLDIRYAYGNAETDIHAYARNGISKNSTFIIGENAGKENTVAISGDYRNHYQWLESNLD